MSHVHHVQRFHGLPVYTFPSYAHPEDLPDAGAVAWRLSCGPYPTDEDSEACWGRFTGMVELEKVRALILGYPWYDSFGGSDDAVIGPRDRFTGLEATSPRRCRCGRRSSWRNSWAWPRPRSHGG